MLFAHIAAVLSFVFFLKMCINVDVYDQLHLHDFLRIFCFVCVCGLVVNVVVFVVVVVVCFVLFFQTQEQTVLVFRELENVTS